MSGATVANLTLDLIGLPNPEPILRVADAAADWAAGETVRVLADDECFTSDFLRWCAGRELDVLSLRYLATGVTELTIRMPGVRRGLQMPQKPRHPAAIS
ncbi:MAG TPA: sulfurtransferase TusA family protein [Candidatus Dormibacteraeota bacterium]|jgi:TusA-related sulfurtransferase